MPVAKIRGVDIVYRTLGERGPWLALTQGGRRSHDEILPISKLIAASGFRVLLHDRRNTGASEIAIFGDDSEEAIWADDLAELLRHIGAVPAFVGGFSSGSRMSLLFALRHPRMVRGLLLCRITGGSTAATRLPENYYGQFIRAAERGRMHAVIETQQYQERIAANPGNRVRLLALGAVDYIATMSHWRDHFIAGAHHPVMGISPEQLASIKVPAVIIPGNDLTHSRESGLAAQRDIPNAELHALPIQDQDRDLIPYAEWAPYESKIAEAFAGFMQRIVDMN